MIIKGSKTIRRDFTLTSSLGNSYELCRTELNLNFIALLQHFDYMYFSSKTLSRKLLNYNVIKIKSRII